MKEEASQGEMVCAFRKSTGLPTSPNCDLDSLSLLDREGITQIQALLSAQQPAGIRQRWVSSGRQQQEEVRMNWEGEKPPPPHYTVPERPGSPLLPSLTTESDPSGTPRLGLP